MSPVPRDAELVLPPTRNLGTAVSAGLAALVVIAFAVALVVDPLVPSGSKPAVVALAALFAGTLAVVAVTLGRGHGALWLDRAQRRIGLGVTRHRDVWWLPIEQLVGLRMQPLALSGATIERWLLALDVRDAPEVVLAESDDRGFLSGIGGRLAAHLGLAFAESSSAAPDTPSAYRSTEIHYAVKRGAALQVLLIAFGASLIAFGVLAFTELEREPLIGFIFAPILLVMGTALAAVSLVKRLATEHLAFDGARWTHTFSFGRWRWGARTVAGPSARFRIRLLGMRGAMLELIGDDGSLVLAAGATAHSHLGLPEVAALPRRFAAG